MFGLRVVSISAVAVTTVVAGRLDSSSETHGGIMEQPNESTQRMVNISICTFIQPTFHNWHSHEHVNTQPSISSASGSAKQPLLPVLDQPEVIGDIVIRPSKYPYLVTTFAPSDRHKTSSSSLPVRDTMMMQWHAQIVTRWTRKSCCSRRRKRWCGANGI